MYIIYQLKFSDKTFYIGQTKDLNSRLKGHKSLWKKELGLDIVNIKILDTATQRENALKLEKHYIASSDSLKLRNVAELDARYQKTHILEPTELIHCLEQEELSENLIFLKRQVKKLEGRYIKTWSELEKMKENMKYLDTLVEEAVEEALGGAND